MKKCKISIIIPMFNAQKYITKTIDSLLNQTFQDFEIIIIDDGSTDDSHSIILTKYKKEIQEKKINLIHQYNFGASAARNKGMEYANGEYYCFLDADDIYEKNAMEKMYKEITEKKADLLISSIQMIDENDNIIARNIFFSNKDSFKLDRKEFYMYNEIPLGKLYKSSIIKEYDIKWDNLHARQDTNFYYKYLCCTEKVAILNDIVGSYRNEPNSIAHAKNFNLLDLKKSLTGIEKFCKEKQLYNKNKKYLQIVKIRAYYINLSTGIKKFDKRLYRKFVSKYFYNELKKVEYKSFDLKKETLKEIRKIKLLSMIKILFSDVYYLYSKIKKSI